jgi:predicted MFS family arabinose efflux permease
MGSIVSNRSILSQGTGNTAVMAQTDKQAVSAALGGMIAMAVGIGIGRFVYTPILPPMIAALGLSKATAGLIASANFLGYMTGALGAARAALPGPKRLWLLGALAFSAATTGAMGLDFGLAWFLALRFLGGAASALVLILASALTMDRLATAGRPGLSALHFSGVGVGIAVSAVLVGFVPGWDAMWFASGLASAIGLVLCAVFLPSESDRSLASAASGTATRDPRLWRMTVAYGLFGFGYVITATFLVAIVRTEVPHLESSIWVMVGLGAAPSVWLWGLLGRRIGTAQAFAVAAIVEAIGVMASVASAGALSVSLGAVLLGGTFMGLTALGLTRARELATGDPRRAMAAMTGAFGAGQIVGPLVAGVLSDSLGGFIVPSALAAGALAGAAWLANSVAPEHREP